MAHGFGGFVFRDAALGSCGCAHRLKCDGLHFNFPGRFIERVDILGAPLAVEALRFIDELLDVRIFAACTGSSLEYAR